MARDQYGPPPEFVAFVERRAPGLRSAAHSMSGNDRLAESFVDDLLAAVAVRWRWLGFASRRDREAAADSYLDRIFHREAVAWRRAEADHGGVTDLRVVADSRGTPSTAGPELAAFAWDLGTRMRRRRWLITAAVAAVAVAAVCAAPDRGGQPPQVAEPLPTALPPLVDVLPSYADQGVLSPRRSPLPRTINLDPAAAAGWLSAEGVSRALAIFLPPGSPAMVLGTDGRIRQIDAGLLSEVRLRGGASVPPMTTTSLSPDGTLAAFLGNAAVTVVDLRTATPRKYPAPAAPTAVTWLTPETLLVSDASDSIVLDLQTGRSAPTTLTARHALSGRGGALGPVPSPGAVPSPGDSAPSASPTATGTPRSGGAASPAATDIAIPAELASRVVELLPEGEPATAPARIRRYQRTTQEVATEAVSILSGDRIGWLGAWEGPGFLVGGVSGRAARDCPATGLLLPEAYGRATYATVAIDPVAARVTRALVATRTATRLEAPMLLGWLDGRTALVRTGDGATQRILAWRVTDGEVNQVASVSRDALVSLADLTTP